MQRGMITTLQVNISKQYCRPARYHKRFSRKGLTGAKRLVVSGFLIVKRAVYFWEKRNIFYKTEAPQNTIREINCVGFYYLTQTTRGYRKFFGTSSLKKQYTTEWFAGILHQRKLSFAVGVTVAGALFSWHASELPILYELGVSMLADTVAPEAARDAVLRTGPIAPRLTVGDTQVK